MRVFLTGATGFIGSRITRDLVAAGHQVVGNARSDRGARQLEAAGAEVHRGDLEDPVGLARGAERADAVIHTAFDHDFSRYEAACAKDGRVIAALSDVLLGSDRPLIITSGVAIGTPAPGEFAREDVFNRDDPIARVASERAGDDALQRGVSSAVVRLPQVHDTVKQGLISPMIEIARARGVSPYVGDGANRWCAAAVDDVARLYVLALAHHRPGARWHAVAEEAVPMRSIAEAVGAGLGVPVVSLTPAAAAEHFGWMALFAALDMPASSAMTREQLGWVPTGPTLIEDLQRMDYTATAE